MIRNYQKNAWLFVILAMALTGIGYAIDTDPAYPKISTTLIEFTLIVTFIFVVLSIAFLGFNFVIQKIFDSK